MGTRRSIAEFAMYWCLLVGAAAGALTLWALSHVTPSPDPTVAPVLALTTVAVTLLSVAVALRARLGRPTTEPSH
ncbi:hypothetical protein HZS55_11685 [Halosimplex rubrum]|uniref:Uncharacterized protein n=1 Tax=Halosimplex rubrum TaxID=869889 RepID=A0A7D5P0W2_9EURY|nr:hypothetical protein [Halosimplex rubrum]QLH77917.1 hypothetical protein HZS55_11685 [Halosimplex rubrum]